MSNLLEIWKEWPCAFAKTRVLFPLEMQFCVLLQDLVHYETMFAQPNFQ